MGTITTGVGLISGLDTAALIDSLITLESRSKFNLEDRIGSLQTQRTAMLDINARLLALKSAASAFRTNSIFSSARTTSSNEELLTATATTRAQPGSFNFIVKSLVTTSQSMTRGFATKDVSPLGLDQLSFEFGNGRLERDQLLEDLNGGLGVDRGRIVIDDNGTVETIDLTDAVTIGEVAERINDASTVDVSATFDGDHLVITSNGGTPLTISDAVGDTTATDLGIAGTDAGGTITGTSVFYLAGTTALSALNDGNGVLTRNNVTDIKITSRAGNAYDIDLGRIDEDIDSATLLSELNDGNGISIDSDTDTADILFVDRDGTEHEVDLSGVTTVGGLIGRVSTETGGRIALSVSASGDSFDVTDTVGTGSGNLQVKGTEDNGTTVADELGILNETGVAGATFTGEIVPSTIDKAKATTLQEVIDRITEQTGGEVTARISADNLRLELEDNSGAGNLIVESTAANPDAAKQLGIETEPGGFSGGSILTGDRLLAGLNTVLLKSINGGSGAILDQPGTMATFTSRTLIADLNNGTGIGTVGGNDILVTDRDGGSHQVELDGLTDVGDVIDAFNSATGGTVTLSIQGQGLFVTDNTGGSGVLGIADLGGGSAATDLGINFSGSQDTVDGADIPLPLATGLDITNRDGVQTIVDLSTAESVQDVISLINSAGAGVTASVNNNGTGLSIVDTTGGTASNLIIAGNDATFLGITADVAATSVQGTNLQLQYVSSASKLSDLNYGRGIGQGTFRITDGLGGTAEVNIGSTEETLYDVVAEINSRGLAINARINDNGDGIVIEEDPLALGGTTPFVKLKIEAVSGTTAADLNILGESDTVVGASIDGSYEAVVDLETSDSLDDVVSKIQDAGIPINATIINTGSGSTPYRLSISSGIAGAAGDLVIDSGGVDLGLSTLARGADARVFFGADNPEDAILLTSSSNTLDEVVPGVTIDLHKASDEVVTLSIARDTDAIVSATKLLVTSFNDAIGRMDDYDFYNQETEERGVLLGDPTVAQVRTSLYRVANGRALNVDGSFQFMSQIGIRFNGEGQMIFDESRFREAYASNPDEVEAVLATYEVSSGGTEEIVEGVTIEQSDLQYNGLGFGNLFDRLLDDLTNSIDGTLSRADDGFETRIGLLEDRIEFLDARLESRREQLTRQFTAMEETLAQLQAQGSSLASLQSLQL